jgi:cephalosporin hydroxylase
MNYRFSSTFYVDNRAIENFNAIFSKFGCPKTIVEVGVYEGYTTFWFSSTLAEHNKDLKIYAIDPHVGSNDLTDVDFNFIRDNFCYNLEVNKDKNVEYLQKFSSEALVDLIKENVKADLIYIDGDHRASTVLSDLVLSWHLLNIGGVIICDDTNSWKFTDENGTSSPHMSPRMAVETFIACNWDKLNILQLPNSEQTAFVKIKE